MATGDEPPTSQLRAIAQASREDQTEVWKKYKPKKGGQVSWWDLARALEKRRMWARDAKFGDDLAAAYGIAWVEDLFEQGDQETATPRRSTPSSALSTSGCRTTAEEGSHPANRRQRLAKAAAEGDPRL